MPSSRSVRAVSGPGRVLEEGVNLVESPEGFPVFQSLVAWELSEGTAVWIDSGNQASTYALRSRGGPEVMEKVEIGRAFTPFQHHSLVHNLEGFVDEGTELLILPKIDLLYLDGQLSDWEAEELFQETWYKINELEDERGLKIAVSFEKNGFLSGARQYC